MVNVPTFEDFLNESKSNYHEYSSEDLRKMYREIARNGSASQKKTWKPGIRRELENVVNPLNKIKMKSRPTFDEFVNESLVNESMMDSINSIKSGIEKIRKAKEWMTKTRNLISMTNNKDKIKVYMLRMKYIKAKLKMLDSKKALDTQKKKLSSN
jgi:hypothetical protein